VLTPELIRDVWGVEASVIEHPTTGRPLIAYAGIAGAAPLPLAVDATQQALPTIGPGA